ncbi:unnamed protein product, partial [Vitis vinifera]|uniref:Uncharacterized protein n=1 Tax=Vitis vinifera TaxID=29760 RepID=D7TZJ7_VITVI
MTGIGTIEGTKETRTTTTNSSANILPKNRKLNPHRNRPLIISLLYIYKLAIFDPKLITTPIPSLYEERPF